MRQRETTAHDAICGAFCGARSPLNMSARNRLRSVSGRFPLKRESGGLVYQGESDATFDLDYSFRNQIRKWPIVFTPVVGFEFNFEFAQARDWRGVRPRLNAFKDL
jgi:hypothetical protein